VHAPACVHVFVSSCEYACSCAVLTSCSVSLFSGLVISALLGRDFAWGEFFGELDLDGDGTFDFKEFAAGAVKLLTRSNGDGASFSSFPPLASLYLSNGRSGLFACARQLTPPIPPPPPRHYSHMYDRCPAVSLHQEIANRSARRGRVATLVSHPHPHTHTHTRSHATLGRF
jgi:hypothetical protein